MTVDVLEIEFVRGVLHLNGRPAGDWVAEVYRLRAEVDQLKLAEEGSEEAFGAVVQQKRDAEAQCKKLQGLLDACYKICGELARPSGI